MIALVGAYVAKESGEALAVISAVWLWPNMQQRTN